MSKKNINEFLFMNDSEQDDQTDRPNVGTSSDSPICHSGADLHNPMILNPESLKDVDLGFENLVQTFNRRRVERFRCPGTIALTTLQGHVVSRGELKDINEKSCGLKLAADNLNIDDVYYLKFNTPQTLALHEVKVVLRRIQPDVRQKHIVGIEFLDKSATFQKKLTSFIDSVKCPDKIGFGDNEVI